MGLFDFFKKQPSNNSIDYSQPTYTPPKQEPPQNTGNILNLNKNDILDLNKGLSRVRVAAGWDVNEKRFESDYDLDLCAYLMTDTGAIQDRVYYGDKRARGIYLDGDNLTGAGEGDDENIYVTLDTINSSVTKIVFAVVIYNAEKRRQKFENVKNAYVRLVDVGGKYESELCRYNLSDNGGDNTAVVFASLNRTEQGWQFQAIGNYTCATISTLQHKLKQMM